MIAWGVVRDHHPSCPARSGGVGCICPPTNGVANLQQFNRKGKSMSTTTRAPSLQRRGMPASGTVAA